MTITTENKIALKNMEVDPNNRYMSFEHFHKAFIQELNKKENQRNVDFLTLHLFAYLASWGMLRGSTFSLQKDYLFHKSVIEILLEEKYERLLDISWRDYDESIVNDILELKERIVAYYKSQSYIPSVYSLKPTTEKITNVSDVLVSKILLGSYACVPAYDDYVRKGLGLVKPRIISTFNKKSLIQLLDFAKKNETELEETSKLMEEGRETKYSDMKLLDTYFFTLGAS